MQLEGIAKATTLKYLSIDELNDYITDSLMEVNFELNLESKVATGKFFFTASPKMGTLLKFKILLLIKLVNRT